jgi:hypothetical protein
MTAPTHTEAPTAARAEASAARTDAFAAYRRRVDGADWAAITAELDELGGALTPRLLTAADAAALVRLYDRDDAFRSTVTMGRHRFGEGEYRSWPARSPRSSMSSAMPFIRTCCRSPVTGTRSSGGSRRGPIPWTSGLRCATRPARPSRPR